MGSMVLLMVMIGLMAAAVVAAIAATAAVVVTIVTLVALAFGILSTSILVAYLRKSATAGARLFVLLGCAIGGGLVGLAAAALLIAIDTVSARGAIALPAGFSFGTAMGLLIGYVLNAITAIAFDYLRRHVRPAVNPAS